MKTVEFAVDGKLLATGGAEGVLRVWDVDREAAGGDAKARGEAAPLDATKRVNLNKLAWHRGASAGATGGHLLTTGDASGAVITWDTRTMQRTCEAKVGALVMDLEMSEPTGLLTVAAGEHVSFFDPSDLRLVKRVKVPVHFREEGGASLRPDGKRFVIGGSDCHVRVFDFATGEMVEQLKGHHGPVRCLRYHPDGAAYATGSEDGTIRLWADSQPEGTRAPPEE